MAANIETKSFSAATSSSSLDDADNGSDVAGGGGGGGGTRSTSKTELEMSQQQVADVVGPVDQTQRPMTALAQQKALLEYVEKLVEIRGTVSSLKQRRRDDSGVPPLTRNRPLNGSESRSKHSQRLRRARHQDSATTPRSVHLVHSATTPADEAATPVCSASSGTAVADTPQGVAAPISFTSPTVRRKTQPASGTVHRKPPAPWRANPFDSDDDGDDSSAAIIAIANSPSLRVPVARALFDNDDDELEAALAQEEQCRSENSDDVRSTDSDEAAEAAIAEFSLDDAPNQFVTEFRELALEDW